MKRLKTSTKVIIFGSVFLILLTVFFSFLNYNMHTYLDSGEEYKQNWYCKEYNFKCLLDRIIVNLSYRNENQYNYPYCHAQASELHEEYFVVGHHM